MTEPRHIPAYLRRDYPMQEQDARNRGDKRGILYGGTSLQPHVLDLSVAQPPKEFNLSGDVIYIDKLSTGTVLIRLDTTWQRGFPFGANAAMRNMQYKTLILEWEAQPNKTMVVWYGYGIEIIPPSQDITSIGGINTAVNVIEQPYAYGASFSSNTLLGSNSSQQVLAPGSNVAGAVAHACGWANITDATSALAFQAHTSAPNSIVVGDLLSMNDQMIYNSGTPLSYQTIHDLNRPILIDVGKGLYFTQAPGSELAIGQGNRFANYTVL